MKGGKHGYLPGEVPDSDDELVKPPPRQKARPPAIGDKGAPRQLPTLEDDDVSNSSKSSDRPQQTFVGMVKRASVVAYNIAAEMAPEYDVDEKQRIEEEAELRLAGGGKAGMMKRAAKRLDVASMWLVRRWTYYLITWPGFDTVMGLVVMANGVTIGLESTHQSAIPLGCDESCICETQIPCVAVPQWIRFVDYGFLGMYAVEFALRVLVFRLSVLRSGWVRFDLLLVVIGVVDVIISQVVDTAVLKQMMLLRLLRLARLARMVRLIVQFRTLWTLVQGLLFTFVPLVWTFVVTSLLMFIFAVLGMELIHINTDLGMNHPYNVVVNYQFRHVMDAGMLMMMVASFDGTADVYRPLTTQNTAIFLFFWFAILIFSIALMNLITAIIVEGSMAMAEEDKEVAKAQAAAKKKKQMEQLKVMFRELDEDGSGEVSQQEIQDAPEDVLEHLTEIAGTDDIPALFEMLDYDGGGTLEVDEFCDGVFKASTSSKPMEIDRLIKQCNDILSNQRSAVAMLQGREAGSKLSCDGSANSKGSKNTPGKPQSVRAKNPVLHDMENRCEQLDARIESLKESTAKLLHGVEQLPTPLCLPKRASSAKFLHKVQTQPTLTLAPEKALAVCRGHSANSNRPRTSPEPQRASSPELSYRVQTQPTLALTPTKALAVLRGPSANSNRSRTSPELQQVLRPRSALAPARQS